MRGRYTQPASRSVEAVSQSKAIEDFMMKKPVQTVRKRLETKQNRQISKVACTESPEAIRDALRYLQEHIDGLAAPAPEVPAPDQPTIETPNADGQFQNPDESQIYGDVYLL